MKKHTINLYGFEELSDEAKETAINNNYDINVDYDWWDFTSDDARIAGLTLIEFDTYRGTIKAKFNLGPLEVAANIIRDHGETCETYRIAERFLSDHAPIFSEYVNENSPDYESSELEDKLMGLENEFLNGLQNEYLSLLVSEYEYLTSEEAIKETLISNEYTFTNSGEMYNV